MSLTNNGPASLNEKAISSEDNFYGELITEIELGEDNVQLMADVKSVDHENEPNTEDEPQTQSADLPSTNSSNVLSQDDAVSEFFTVDAKADSVFDNDMIITEIDGEGIDFKNETDVVECHHDYNSKKLLFEDEDLVVEDVPVMEEEEEAELRLPAELEVNEPCFEITAEDERYVNKCFHLTFYRLFYSWNVGNWPLSNFLRWNKSILTGKGCKNILFRLERVDINSYSKCLS